VHRIFQIIFLTTTIAISTFTPSANSVENKMAGPSENGVLIYSNDTQKLAAFYEKLFSMQVSKETKDFISLDKSGFNIIIHVPPAEIPSENFSPIKLFLTVQSLSQTRKEALELGGQVFKGEWSNPIFTVANIADSDGNHIQVREFAYNNSMQPTANASANRGDR
jgi:predicted enzyme related to lactoylglutathione lyase